MHFGRMNRRHVLTLLGAAGWHSAADAQQPNREYRVGFLLPAGRQTAAVLAMFDELHLNGF